ncbi:MAG: hypothetical protein LC655_06015, partial [Bacteroidales bacterium]|nr:hypothetical protein [Bacteroidales bacterium]
MKNDRSFYCPMKCEGEKIYEQPGKCPVCHMNLVSADEKSDEHKGQEQQHPTHSHGKNGHEHHHAKHGESEQKEHHHGKSPENKNRGEYYCPMHCEGEKTYDHPGDCPVCGMDLKREEQIGKSGSGDTTYTCPMHPEVKQDHPGSCPKCGMDLVPEKGAESSEEEKSYKKMAKKFWIALALSIPVFIIAMSDMISFLNLEAIAPKIVWRWAEFVLATPVVFYTSWIFFKRGWSSIRRWSPNMWTLISIGVGAAYLF